MKFSRDAVSSIIRNVNQSTRSVDQEILKAQKEQLKEQKKQTKATNEMKSTLQKNQGGPVMTGLSY